MSDDIDTLPRWVTIQRTATWLDVDDKTVRRMIARGDLKAKHVGPRLIRIDRESIDKVMKPIGGAA